MTRLRSIASKVPSVRVTLEKHHPQPRFIPENMYSLSFIQTVSSCICPLETYLSALSLKIYSEPTHPSSLDLGTGDKIIGTQHHLTVAKLTKLQQELGNFRYLPLSAESLKKSNKAPRPSKYNSVIDDQGQYALHWIDYGCKLQISADADEHTLYQIRDSQWKTLLAASWIDEQELELAHKLPSPTLDC